MTNEGIAMRRRSFIAVLAAVLFALNAHAAVWYVDIDNSSGTEDGTSWATAFPTIQPALDAAGTAGGGDVWVA